MDSSCLYKERNTQKKLLSKKEKELHYITKGKYPEKERQVITVRVRTQEMKSFKRFII